jgi:hypothetical protein
MKILLALGLLLIGYVVGSVDTTPANSQSGTGYYYGNDGTMGTHSTPLEGGPTYYYDNHGNSGTLIPPLSAPNTKSPC